MAGVRIPVEEIFAAREGDDASEDAEGCAALG